MRRERHARAWRGCWTRVCRYDQSDGVRGGRMSISGVSPSLRMCVRMLKRVRRSDERESAPMASLFHAHFTRWLFTRQALHTLVVHKTSTSHTGCSQDKHFTRSVVTRAHHGCARSPSSSLLTSICPGFPSIEPSPALAITHILLQAAPIADPRCFSALLRLIYELPLVSCASYMLFQFGLRYGLPKQ